MLDPKHTRAVNAGGGMLKPAVVVDGQDVGTWKRELAREEVSITISLFGPASPRTRDAIVEAAERYATFLLKRPRTRWSDRA
jgi:hypothetical protein